MDYFAFSPRKWAVITAVVICILAQVIAGFFLHEYGSNTGHSLSCHYPPAFTAQQRRLIQDYIKRRCPQYVTARKTRSYNITQNFYRACDDSRSQAAKSDSKCDITLISQMTVKRFPMLETVASRWSGPITITLYGTNKEVTKLIRLITKSNVLSNRCNVIYHHVQNRFKPKKFRGKPEDLYPINLLRTVALKSVTTPFVFLIDIDFVFRAGAYERLKQQLHSVNACDKVEDRVAFVMPAFETIEAAPRISAQNSFPETKAQLIGRWLGSNRTIVKFHNDIYPQGHAATNYERWAKATDPYRVRWKGGYEPYFVARTELLHLYDNRMFWPFYDKVSHILEMAIQKFKFIVLPDEYLVHFWHPTNPITAPLGEYTCRTFLKNQFWDDLKRKYNTNRAVHYVAKAVRRCARMKKFDMCICN